MSREPTELEDQIIEVTKQTIIKIKIFVLSHSPRQANNQSSFVAVIYMIIMIKQCFLLFHLTSSQKNGALYSFVLLSSRSGELTLKNKMLLLSFFIFKKKKKKQNEMPVTIFVSFRVNLIYVIRECLCRSLKLQILMLYEFGTMSRVEFVWRILLFIFIFNYYQPKLPLFMFSFLVEKKKKFFFCSFRCLCCVLT